MNTALRAAAGTDTGKQRESNEDALLCEPEEGFFAAIDGVGGYAGGEIAAAEARDAIRRRLLHRTGSPEDRLREAVANANNKIYWRSQEEPRFFGMACVLTVVLLEDDYFYAAHVGDTRLYKIRGRQITKLTRDHSFVGMQEDQQVLSEFQAMHHPRRNEILRDVGSEHHEPDDENFIDIVEGPFEADCALLLCSDGLTDLVPSRELLRLVLENAGTPQATAQALIEAANEAGGTDNITVVVVEGTRFDQPALAPPVDTAATRLAAKPAAPDDRTTQVTHVPSPDAPPPVALGARSARWRYYIYGFATALVLAAAVYAASTVWRTAPVPQPLNGTTPVSAVPDSLPGVINALLAAAQPGDTVVVAAGVYRETVRLRSGITLRSARPDSVRLIPPADSARTDTVAVLAEGVIDAALIGFAIGPDTAEATANTASAFAVGLLARRAAVRLDSITITGTTRTAVDIDPGAAVQGGVVLQHSRIADNAGTGIIVRSGGRHVHILDNEIRANAEAGVVLLHEARPELRGNRILANGTGIEIHMDTTLTRLRATNSITQDDLQRQDVRLLTQENNR